MSKKILVADDESNISLLQKRMLGKDYTIIDAQDGQEAVDSAPVNTRT